MPVSKKEVSACPIDAMLSVIDGRWKGTILWRLSDGPLRTCELRRSIPDITERMLIRPLQDLVRDGILIRHQMLSCLLLVRGSGYCARSGMSACRRRSRNQRPPQSSPLKITGKMMLNNTSLTRTCVATAPPR